MMLPRGSSMKIQLVPNELSAKIKVLGVGGAGGNAINDMISSQMVGVDFIAANTDAQALERSLAPVKIQLGQNVTRGLGAGGDPEVGRNAALEDAEHLKQVLQGADMVFIAAGMGGGDEHHVGSLEDLFEVLGIFQGGVASHFGIAAGPQTPGHILTQLDLDRGQAALEGLS